MQCRATEGGGGGGVPKCPPSGTGTAVIVRRSFDLEVLGEHGSCKAAVLLSALLRHGGLDTYSTQETVDDGGRRIGTMPKDIDCAPQRIITTMLIYGHRQSHGGQFRER